MKFSCRENLEKFLSDIKFYESNDCYCLGKTFEEAGEIIREIVRNRNGDNEYVGMDNE